MAEAYIEIRFGGRAVQSSTGAEGLLSSAGGIGAMISSAQLTRPEILLLDEPFGALAALTKVHFQVELQRIWLQEGNPMIPVTQDAEATGFFGGQKCGVGLATWQSQTDYAASLGIVTRSDSSRICPPSSNLILDGIGVFNAA